MSSKRNSRKTGTGKQNLIEEKENKQKSTKGNQWSAQEHAAFLIGLERYGWGHWKEISDNLVPNRTRVQVATHGHKYMAKLERREKSASALAAKEDTPVKRTTQHSTPPPSDSESVSAPSTPTMSSQTTISIPSSPEAEDASEQTVPTLTIQNILRASIDFGIDSHFTITTTSPQSAHDFLEERRKSADVSFVSSLLRRASQALPGFLAPFISGGHFADNLSDELTSEVTLTVSTKTKRCREEAEDFSYFLSAPKMAKFDHEFSLWKDLPALSEDQRQRFSIVALDWEGFLESSPSSTVY